MQVILEKLDLHMARRRARALLPASKRDRIVAAHADRLAGVDTSEFVAPRSSSVSA